MGGENAKAGSKPLRWDDHEGDCEPFLGVVSLVCIFCLRDVCHQTACRRMFFFFSFFFQIMVPPDGGLITPCDLVSLSLGPQNWECEKQVYLFLKLIYLLVMPLKWRG